LSFSDRLGITTPKSILQIDSIDEELRNGLWQACLENLFVRDGFGFEYDQQFRMVMRSIYIDFFKETSDAIPYGYESSAGSVRKWFFETEWYEVYNFLEFSLSIIRTDSFLERVAFFLEREKSGFRLINRQFLPITDPIEIEAVSIAAAQNYAGVQQHIKAAITLFSRKPTPDYRNSIKEAISAVESAAKTLTGDTKATLGDALKTLDAKTPIHGALREAMSKLYGYTSDKGGIRHALLEESDVDEAEAKFMIVACSAFVNFCIQRSQ